MVVGKEPYWITLEFFHDPRGLMAILEDHKIPFEVRRTFWITRIPDNTVRGGHAHRTSEQLLICVNGVIMVELESLSGRKYEFQLSPDQYRGLYLPPLYWGSYIFKQHGMALCMASDHFDEMDYIRDYREFELLKHADRG